MANRFYPDKVLTMERAVRQLILKSTFSPTLVTAATATADLTTDIVYTSVGGKRNGNTITIQVLAAAANPTDTVLASFTGSSAAIVITITPNDGTNNGATPVNLTTAELVELINNGTVAGKTVTVTDASSLRALQTATGGDSTNLADSGEGDGVAATFSGGIDTLSPSRKLGILSLSNTAQGKYRIVLDDKYNYFLGFQAMIQHSSALGYNVEMVAEDVDGSTPYIDFWITDASGSVVDPAAAVILYVSILLKNSSVGS